MATSAYYKIFTVEDDNEITNLVSSFSYEDAVDVDNLLTLQINIQNLSGFDIEAIQEGKLLRFQFGYLGGKSSPKKLVRISDFDPDYARSIVLTLRCTDLGISMKKNNSKKDWKGLTASQMIEEIAKLYGLKAVVDTTTKVYDFMPQGGKSDYDFCKNLAEIQPSGKYRFFLKEDELHFTERNLLQDSKRTYTYGDPNGDVIDFKPRSREMQKKAASRQTVVSSVNPFTGEVINQVVDNASEDNPEKLADYVVHYNENGQEIGVSPSKEAEKKSDPNRTGKFIEAPFFDLDEATAKATNEKKKKELDDITAVLNVNGDPLQQADTIITMSSVLKRDEGNWYVKRVRHNIESNSIYKTRFSLQRNASKQIINADKTKTDTVNKNSSVGPDQVDEAKEIDQIYYDSNGNQLN